MTDASPPAAPYAASPRIETVVVQPTPFCNIDCRYCYLPDRRDTSVLAQETIVALFTSVFASGWASPHLTVIWHAGEPLVLPVDYYREAFAAIDALRPPSIAVRHAFQTNGMLLSPAWCALFRDWNVGVGVSLDGPRAIHDAQRVTRSGKGTFERTLAGIRLLRREGIPFHVISVLGRASLADPDALLAFYRSEGIADICFNVEESEGDHRSTLFADVDVEPRFRAFLARFWSEARRTPDVQFLREIDSMLPRIFRPDDTPVDNEQVRPFGMLNVDCRGNVSSFSPELLGLRNAGYGDFVVGNILVDTLAEMLERPAMRAMARDIAAGVDRCRRECGYFSVCGGGSPINKLTENGTFASSTTTFCTLVHKVPADLVLAAFDRFEGAVARGAAPLAPLAPWIAAASAQPTRPPTPPVAPPATPVARSPRLNDIPVRSA